MDTRRDQRSHSRRVRWGGGGEKQPWGLQRHFKGVGAGNASCGGGADREEGGKPVGGLRRGRGYPHFGAGPPGRLFRRVRLLFTSTCSTGTSRGRGPPPPLPSRLFSTFHPRRGVNSHPGGGSRAGENLSLTWSVASGIYSLNPDETGVWGGRGS